MVPMMTFSADKKNCAMKEKRISSTLILVLAVLSAGSAFAQIDRPPIVEMDFEMTDNDGKLIVSEPGNLAEGAQIKELWYAAELVEQENGQVLKLSDVQAIREAKTFNHGCVVIEDFPNTFPDGLTFQARVNVAEVEKTNYEGVLFSNQTSDRSPGISLQVQSSGLLRVFTHRDTPTGLETAGIPFAGPILPFGEWVTVVLTHYDGESILYLDGMEYAHSYTPGPLGEGGTRLTIGAYNGGYAYGFEGQLDDVRIFDYARTPEQIAEDSKVP